MTNQPDTGALHIAVSDFGPIVEANLDLRPLTVFVGPSNTGKSYLAILIYAVQCFFGGTGIGGNRGLPSFFRRLLTSQGSVDRLSAESIETLADWAATLSSEIPDDRDRELDDVLPEPVAEVIRERFTSMHRAGSPQDDLETEIKRCFGIDAIEGLIRRPPGTGKSHVTLRRRASDDPPFEYGFAMPAASGPLRISLPAETPLHVAKIPLKILLEAASEHRLGVDKTHAMEGLVYTLLVSAAAYALGPLSRPVHYLPADRTGVMHAHRVVVGSLVGRASQTSFRQDSPSPVLSGVLADFLGQLIELGDREPQVDVLRVLAARLEREILTGAVQARQSETGYPTFRYRPDGWKTDLPLMNTSSMVSELAPVVLYLREVVQPGDTLIIEEPESHLHPAMQVEFTRLLAATVKAGIRVVITTHSEWVLETLANLVRLSALPKEQRAGIAGADIALTPREVGAWLFRPKKRPRGTVVEEIPLDVEAGTFPAGYGEITEDLYNDWARISNLAQKAAQR